MQTENFKTAQLSQNAQWTSSKRFGKGFEEKNRINYTLELGHSKQDIFQFATSAQEGRDGENIDYLTVFLLSAIFWETRGGMGAGLAKTSTFPQ